MRACRVSAYVSLEQHAVALVVLDAGHKESVPNPTLLSYIVVYDPAQTKGICRLSAACHISTQKVCSAFLPLAITHVTLAKGVHGVSAPSRARHQVLEKLSMPASTSA